jgi:UDP-N-acetylglucosamine 1-carboxyvinyltransferase
LTACREIIDLSDSSLPVSALGQVYLTVLHSHPELFHVALRLSYRCTESTVDGVPTLIVTEVYPAYTLTGVALTAARADYRDMLAAILTEMELTFGDHPRTEADTVLYLHDYLADRYTYDTRADAPNADAPRAANADAYTFLRDGRGICQAYALTFLALCQGAGLEADLVVSDAMDHAWNHVRVEGEWYHVDVTRDDPIPAAEGTDKVNHLRLLRSDKGMEALGAKVATKGGVLAASADELIGGDIFLEMPSVGATVNCMLTAVSANGTTCIHNAAKEPHIVDLANFLSSMGAVVKGAGTDVIRIRGGRHLHGTNYTVVPDQIETGTLMIAAAATGGDVIITGTIPTHMEALSAKLLEMGVHVSSEDDIIHVRSNRSFRSVNVKTQGYPGFPTDLAPQMAVLMANFFGGSITENVWHGRFGYLESLRSFGVRYKLSDGKATLIPSTLRSASVRAPDLRGGAACMLAALAAKGRSEIYAPEVIMRGYSDFCGKLRTSPGAAGAWNIPLRAYSLRNAANTRNA